MNENDSGQARAAGLTLSLLGAASVALAGTAALMRLELRFIDARGMALLGGLMTLVGVIQGRAARGSATRQ